MVDQQKRPPSRILAEAKGVGVRNRDRWLVRGIDMAVRSGEIVSLIGPNGSGKSTTAKTILGLIKPDEGEVAVAAGLRVGYVPQRFPIDWTLPLSVGRLMTLTGSYASSEIESALAEVGIAHLIEAEVSRLSGGEFQRALIARAMIRKPDLLVLDEPVQGVDFSGEIALYELIGALRDRSGCGVLLISHDLHIVMAQTDTVVCLDGHVCCSGTPQTVAASAEYRQLFGHRAAEAIAVYHHHHDHQHLSDGSVAPFEHALGENDHAG